MSAYQLPPLPARPLPPLSPFDEARRQLVLQELSGAPLQPYQQAIAESMRVEIEQRFEEVLDA